MKFANFATQNKLKLFNFHCAACGNLHYPRRDERWRTAESCHFQLLPHKPLMFPCRVWWWGCGEVGRGECVGGHLCDPVSSFQATAGQSAVGVHSHPTDPVSLLYRHVRRCLTVSPLDGRYSDLREDCSLWTPRICSFWPRLENREPAR